MAATIARGVRAPIIREGDDIVKITADCVEQAMREDGFSLSDRDIVAVTEAVVARAAGNYASVDDIATDVSAKLPGGTVGVVFPILSRNRFAICLRGIARGAKKVVVQLSYPSDEVGNHLLDPDVLDDSGVNPYSDVLTADAFEARFGTSRHPFTGMDYIGYYRQLIEEEGAEAEIVLANRPEAILAYTDTVLCADIHTRERTARRIRSAGGRIVLTLTDILNAPVNGSGCNARFGLLGSNKATEQTVKLFPENAQAVAEGISRELSRRTGKHIEAMVYGDGAFKDPIGKIWELADPTVAPGFTAGLNGLPNELKLKYLADNDFAGLSGDALRDAIRKAISEKDADLKGQMASEGTTPRRLTDLIGSLCDLTSGSGDKGTPIVVVQNYFKNYAM
ncbi:MAG: coenzyme F420-0:L-glutamate ligase [Clostridium sp.]|nr:coenzyme F420-0:L-glutamate ligase [Clostridium sp.]MDD7139361.1 coenzyme F420-0:L-glutamate ligase [Clostridium sp.]MDY6081353.1 coenzyme F420-0:L-glutamate ligase [Eubacteriales bacterium]